MCRRSVSIPSRGLGVLRHERQQHLFWAKTVVVSIPSRGLGVLRPWISVVSLVASSRVSIPSRGLGVLRL